MKSESKLMPWKTNGKYYYTDNETILLKNLKLLFKKKSLRNKYKTFTCCSPEIEKIPDTNCKIKVEAWQSHDHGQCSGDCNEYHFIGQIIFPICGKTIFDEIPGVIIHKSLKSTTLNERSSFGNPHTEDREYAFPYRVLTEQSENLDGPEKPKDSSNKCDCK